MSKKLLVALAAASTVLTLSWFAFIKGTSADAGCLTNAYLNPGGATIEQVFTDLPETIGTSIAQAKALANVATSSDPRVLDTKLARVSDSGLPNGVAVVYLVSTSVDEPVYLHGYLGGGTAACEVSFIDAKTGEFEFSYLLAEPRPGSTFVGIPDFGTR